MIINVESMFWDVVFFHTYLTLHGITELTMKIIISCSPEVQVMQNVLRMLIIKHNMFILMLKQIQPNHHRVVISTTVVLVPALILTPASHILVVNVCLKE